MDRRPRPLGLLDLPVEVRLQVYHHCVPQARFFSLHNNKDGHWLSWDMDEEEYHRTEDSWLGLEGNFPVVSISALLRAHSTCHREVVPLLYTQNTFRLHDVVNVVDWVATIGPSNAALIRSLKIRYTTPAALDYHGQFFETLADLSGIRSLAIGKLGPRFRRRGDTPWHPWLLLFAQEILKEMPWLTLVYHKRSLRYQDQIRYATAEDDGPHESMVDESLIILPQTSEDFEI